MHSIGKGSVVEFEGMLSSSIRSGRSDMGDDGDEEDEEEEKEEEEEEEDTYAETEMAVARASVNVMKCSKNVLNLVLAAGGVYPRR